VKVGLFYCLQHCSYQILGLDSRHYSPIEMIKKLIIPILYLCSTTLVLAQNVTIFFLKDGSIIQGKVVNENQNRIFLKTEQGTIKILPAHVLGREDLAREGDLTYMTDRVDHLQNHVDHLNGQVDQLHDSLKMAMDDLFEYYKNMEVLQNEFEIDLLRLYSRNREQKNQIDHNQSDLVDHRVDIASNRQNLGGLSDTVSTMQKYFHTTSQKLNNTANQSYLLTGAVSNIKSELQTAASERKGHQNQIDIMAGSLAHLIQEVQKVQNEFSTMNEGIKANQKGIGKLTEELKIQIRELNLGIEKMLDDLDQQVKTINQKLDEQDKNSLKARQMISSDLDDIKDEFAKLKNKISSLDKDITALNSDVKKLNIKVDNILIEE